MRSKFKDEHPFGEPNSIRSYCETILFIGVTYHRETQGGGRAYPPEVPRSYSCQYLAYVGTKRPQRLLVAVST